MKVHNYNNFVLENYTSREILTEDAFIHILRTKCSKYRHTLSHGVGSNPTLLYRTSTNRGDYTLFTKPTSPRYVKISGTLTGIINRLKSWKDYPNRLFSLLASTNSYYPKLILSYEESNSLNIVIPFDNSRIAVCPDVDFNSGNDYNTNFEYFNKIFDGKVNNKYVSPDMVMFSILGSYHNWKSNNKIINEYNNAILDHSVKAVGNYFEREGILSMVRACWDKHKGNYKSPFDMFIDGMDPDKNGFKIIKYGGDNRIFPNNEIWTTDNCLLISKDKYDEFVEKGIIPSH